MKKVSQFFTTEKEVYVVRHGATSANKNFGVQESDEDLSEEGVFQSESLADRFASIPLDIILSSPYKRALETAKQIQKKQQVPLKIVESAFEFVPPTQHATKKAKNEEEYEAIQVLIRSNELDPKWHFEGEENLFEFARRMKDVMLTLEAKVEKRIVLVSHGLAIKMLLALLFSEGDVDKAVEHFRRSRLFFVTSNTGITHLLYGDYKGTPQWRVHVLNDVAHLGEE
jgi:broad specificity phosphatase PhoE